MRLRTRGGTPLQQLLPDSKLAITRIILVMNPQSTNIQRIGVYARELASLFPRRSMVTVETSVQPAQFARRLRTALAAPASLADATLIAIGGGDGTVNLVLNTLLGLRPKINLEKTPLLPLWGGNANDLASMLNGLSYRARLISIVARAQLVAIHPFKVTLISPTAPIVSTGPTTTSGAPRSKRTVRYAACYASFGAIAYAADQLAKPHPDHRLLGKSAAGTFADEMIRAWRAILDAPTYDAEQDGQRMKIFEHVFANGSRMAKVDRLPVKLNERAFYRAAGSDNHPLFFMLRLIRGKKVGEVTNKPARFTLKERAWAQFDGEVVVLAENTTITIAHASRPFYALTTKLHPLEDHNN
jgi:diacylglycerol kinase family enzyme